jgi:hypothetical protein
MEEECNNMKIQELIDCKIHGHSKRCLHENT